MNNKRSHLISVQNNHPNLLLILAVIVAAFIAGSFYSKSQNLQKKGFGAQNIPSGPPSKASVGVGHLAIKGSKSAKVTIIAFEDFRCPFCKRFFEETEGQLIKEYVDTGKARFAFRQYQFLGPASITAGLASECANEQNKFWEFHDYMYKNQPSESDTSLFVTNNLTDIASNLGMDANQFRSCLDSKKYQKNITEDLSEGQKAGVNATPTFFINGISIVGAQPYVALKTVIDQELSK